MKSIIAGMFFCCACVGCVKSTVAVPERANLTGLDLFDAITGTKQSYIFHEDMPRFKVEQKFGLMKDMGTTVQLGGVIAEHWLTKENKVLQIKFRYKHFPNRSRWDVLVDSPIEAKSDLTAPPR